MNTPTQYRDDRFPWEEPDNVKPPENDDRTMRAAAAAPAAPEVTQEDMELAEEHDMADMADMADPVDEIADRLNPLRDRHVAQKEYYSISEVCDLVGLKPHVLRYWETQFQVLNPSKNRSGNRVYQRKEIKLILLVKHLLYEEKYTVEGAKAKLDKLRRTGGIRESTATALGSEMVTLLREDMQRLLDILGPRDTA